MELFEPTKNRRLIAGQLVWFFAWAAVTGFAIYLTPDSAGHGTHQRLGLPPCPSVILFDRPCPGCGLTTSWTAFVHGDFALAFRAHALGPLFYVAFTIGAWMCLYAWIKSSRISVPPRLANRLTTVGIVLFISFGAIRMAVTPGFATPSEKWFSKLGISK